MHNTLKPPECSIIIPVLNEAEGLRRLFGMLSDQRDVDFEVILCDGASTDNTKELALKLVKDSPFHVTILEGKKGRGKQMNCGAAVSRANTLLFLHADSFFREHHALRTGIDELLKAIEAKGDERVAGHFSLCFKRQNADHFLSYYYLECKARLNRKGCTHGDQGFLLPRAFFYDAGPFDESLPLLEDEGLADIIREKGEWILFSSEIFTSARRFETEGMYERQVVNAFVMNFFSIGWQPFFREIPDIYRSQDRTKRLNLFPFLQRIKRLLAPLPLPKRFSLWYAAGSYARSNAWQLAFAMDMRRNFRKGISPGKGSASFLVFFDRYYDRFTDHSVGRLLAAVLVWFWFHLTCYLCSKKMV